MAQQSLNLKTLPPLPSLKDMALSAIKEAILYKKASSPKRVGDFEQFIVLG